jgi:hypothetical protein
MSKFKKGDEVYFDYYGEYRGYGKIYAVLRNEGVYIHAPDSPSKNYYIFLHQVGHDCDVEHAAIARSPLYKALR